jgi:hypothetical protein
MSRSSLGTVCGSIWSHFLWSTDWNFWGALLFFLGSLFYLVCGILSYVGEDDIATHLDFAADSLFVIDSLIYLWAWYVDKRANATPTAEQEHLVKSMDV